MPKQTAQTAEADYQLPDMRTSFARTSEKTPAFLLHEANGVMIGFQTDKRWESWAGWPWIEGPWLQAELRSQCGRTSA